jgi:hypothetical protein
MGLLPTVPELREPDLACLSSHMLAMARYFSGSRELEEIPISEFQRMIFFYGEPRGIQVTRS